MHIDVWYGSHQHFGSLGNPQRWVNILGTVANAKELATLVYSLNGGDPVPLSIGPDTLRLRAEGDFNAEIPVAALCDGENQVLFKATGHHGSRATRLVTVHYSAGNRWPLPYTVDFREVTNISDAVQVVEGKWELTPEGIRPKHPSYDRLVSFGDVDWQDYEVTLTATINGFVQKLPFTAESEEQLIGGFGLLFRWTGHHQDKHQPHREWRPNGAIGWYRARWEDSPTHHRCLNISDAVVKDVALVETSPQLLELGRRYVFQFSVESRAGATSLYRYRVWQEAQPGDLLCDLSTAGREGEAPRGSVLLIALYADVTLAQICAVPLLKVSCTETAARR